MSATWDLTLNVPGDCGSSQPTRVEPPLHCVGIEWQLRGRCVGSAAHSPLALSAARAIEPGPMHFVRICALGVPRTYNEARALRGPAHVAWVRVGPRIMRGPRRFAWACELCNPRAWPPMRWYPFPCNFWLIQFAIQANHAQYYLCMQNMLEWTAL